MSDIPLEAVAIQHYMFGPKRKHYIYADATAYPNVRVARDYT
jgi:hypothetical protein